jgi:redox-regulated HSP33 family molecular chaperone
MDDLVQPFQIEGLGIRGRIVRLGPLVDRVLKAHAYPEPVSRLLGEALALTVMIGSALKFDGRFILQTQSKGPVGMLVADFQTPGSIRGYAQADAAVYQTIRQVAASEGVVLDPVYTGKAFYGMIDRIKRGEFAGAPDIVFVHTGGIFGLLAQRSRMSEWLTKDEAI